MFSAFESREIKKVETKGNAGAILLMKGSCAKQKNLHIPRVSQAKITPSLYVIPSTVVPVT